MLIFWQHNWVTPLTQLGPVVPHSIGLVHTRLSYVQKIFLRQLEVAEPTDEVSGSSININS
jgi:hypothetical protein